MNKHNQTLRYSRHDFARVTQKNPCRICHKPDWCTYTKDGARAYCMREPSGSAWQAGNGAYVHLLQDAYTGRRHSAFSTPPIGDCGSVGTERADADRRDAVYRALLESLELTEAHGNHLLDERGLSDTAVAYKLYASVPSAARARQACDELSRRFDLQGVPGFYKRDGLWRLRCYRHGFYVPYRAAQGRIDGLQVRLDEGEPRYYWFSTSDTDKYPLGASSGTPIHFAKPDLVRQSGFVRITEGALKADRIAEFTDEAWIGLAGVECFKDSFGLELREQLPELQTVDVAFDIDWQEKPEVSKALFRLRRALRAAELAVTVRLWDATLGKGFDDVLFNVERKTDDE